MNVASLLPLCHRCNGQLQRSQAAKREGGGGVSRWRGHETPPYTRTHRTSHLHGGTRDGVALPAAPPGPFFSCVCVSVCVCTHVLLFPVQVSRTALMWRLRPRHSSARSSASPPASLAPLRIFFFFSSSFLFFFFFFGGDG